MLFQKKALPEWGSDDAAALKIFLESDIGQRAIAYVIAEQPSLLDGSDVNKTLVASGQVQGFVLAVESLFRLTHEQPTPIEAPTDYPPLDADAQWDDGQKVHQSTDEPT